MESVNFPVGQQPGVNLRVQDSDSADVIPGTVEAIQPLQSQAETSDDFTPSDFSQIKPPLITPPKPVPLPINPNAKGINLKQPVLRFPKPKTSSTQPQNPVPPMPKASNPVRPPQNPA